jgi:hypothetical protein
MTKLSGNIVFTLSVGLLIVSTAAGGTLVTNAYFDASSPSCSTVPPDTGGGEYYAYCSLGEGGSAFSWGVASGPEFSENLLSYDFSGEGQAVPAVGEFFTASTLLYRNGTIVGDTEVNRIRLTIEAFDSDDLGTPFGTFEAWIEIVNSPNLGISPEADADFIYFPDFPQFGSFRVFEESETSVELIFQRGSLIFQGFGAVTDPGVGFVSPSIFPVPEPASGLTFGGALAALVWRRFRRSSYR